MARNGSAAAAEELDIKNLVAQHGIFALMIQAFITLLQGKHRPMNKSPFDTHGGVMSAFLAYLLLYAIISIVQVRVPQAGIYCVLAGKTRFAAGILAPALLLLVLVPVIGVVILVLWAVLVMILLYHSYQEFMQLQ
ncbi:hypothetical protein Tsubulata_004857 [Turnera subulata]|uniref:Uncharacterized protein n=1 Tax=Turnera subulata TaxID=218843 RepID=A0A9Q0GGS1_9ROSI|nr:hypothetical protein Tsubulata_004857 [Turnera subulata]